MSFFWETIRLKVCRQCIEADSAGNCHMPSGGVCPLEEFFPQIVRTVVNTQLDVFEKNSKEIRNEVCAACPYQGRDGFCQKRKDRSCALDRHFPLVVETIRSLQQTILRTQ
jgi:hypothetical protein